MILKHGKVTVDADSQPPERVRIENFHLTEIQHGNLDGAKECMEWAVAVLREEISKINVALKGIANQD